MSAKDLKPKGNPGTQFKPGKQAKEMGRRGGISSGISRNFTGALKKRLKDNPELFDLIIDKVLDMAIDGDLKAIEALIDLTGESTQRKSLELRREELKLKAKSNDTTSEIIEKLDEVLGGIQSGF